MSKGQLDIRIVSLLLFVLTIVDFTTFSSYKSFSRYFLHYNFIVSWSAVYTCVFCFLRIWAAPVQPRFRLDRFDVGIPWAESFW
jgi:hypothetical protein